VWVACKTVIPLTRAIPERITGSYDDALYKSTFTSTELLGFCFSLFFSYLVPCARLSRPYPVSIFSARKHIV